MPVASQTMAAATSPATANHAAGRSLRRLFMCDLLEWGVLLKGGQQRSLAHSQLGQDMKAVPGARRQDPKHLLLAPVDKDWKSNAFAFRLCATEIAERQPV